MILFGVLIFPLDTAYTRPCPIDSFNRIILALVGSLIPPVNKVFIKYENVSPMSTAEMSKSLKLGGHGIVSFIDLISFLIKLAGAVA